MTQLLAHLVGCFVIQSDWMANNKTKSSWPCLLHCLLYALCFTPLCLVGKKDLTPERQYCMSFVDKFGNETMCQPIAGPKSGPFIQPELPPGAINYRLYATHPEKHIVPGYFRWLPWLVIFGSHFLIDRFQLARYLVYVKNWIGPAVAWYEVHGIWSTSDEGIMPRHSTAVMPPLRACPTGYPPTTPVWLATILLIVADNALHLLINYTALRYL